LFSFKKERKDKEILIQFGVKGFTSKIYSCKLKHSSKGMAGHQPVKWADVATNSAQQGEKKTLNKLGYRVTVRAALEHRMIQKNVIIGKE
jgi:hypothetical protein